MPPIPRGIANRNHLPPSARAAPSFVFAACLLASCVEGPFEPDEVGTSVAASAGKLDKQLWPDNRVHYLVDPDQPWAVESTTLPSCADDSTVTCEQPWRDGVIAAIAEFERYTELDYRNETPTPGGGYPDDLLDHDHPHLFYTTGLGGQTFSYTQLRDAYDVWRAACVALGIYYCDPDRSPQENPIPVTEANDVAWRFVRKDHELLRPAEGRPHDDTLVVTKSRSSPYRPDPTERHYSVAALHETGHAMGLGHEHKRPDRCDAVYYFPCNVDGPTTAFDMQLSAQVLSPYDLGSIMHYASSSKGGDNGGLTSFPLLSRVPIPGVATTAFVENICPTVDDGCGNTTPGDSVIGYQIIQPDHLSFEDVNGLNQLYPAAEHWINEPDDRFGAAMAAGDFDGDGYTDLAVGAPGETVAGVAVGAVYVFKGTYNGLVPWRRLVEPTSLGAGANGDGFGAALAAADLDPTVGPGRFELVVGAPGADIGGNVHAGTAWVYRGHAEGPGGRFGDQRTALTELGFGGVGPQVGDKFGAALAIGNLDGVFGPEIAVGAPGRNAVYAFRSDGTPFTRTTPTGLIVQSTRFGSALLIAKVPETGIGVPARLDLLVGAPGDAGVTQGSIYVVRGGTTLGAPIRVDQPATDGAVGDRFGAALVAGHFASSLATQFVVGAPGFNNRRGRAYLMTLQFGATGALTVTRLKTLHRSDIAGRLNVPDAQFGSSLTVVPSPYATGAGVVLIGAPGLPPSGTVGVGLAGYFAGSSSSTPNLTASTQTLEQPTYHGAVGGYQSFALAMAVGNFDRKGMHLALAAPGKDSGAGAVWVSRAVAPISFLIAPPGFIDNDVEAKTFATFLDQGHFYSHWTEHNAAPLISRP